MGVYLMITIVITIAVIALILLVAYISVLKDDSDNYKLRAERFEELYYEEVGRNMNHESYLRK